MAHILRKNSEGDPEVISLNLGVNRIGSGADNHFRIIHPSVSKHHCDVILAAEGLSLRDCRSAAGTFVNGKRIKKVLLQTGQGIRIGEVDFAVGSTEVIVRIPGLTPAVVSPPVGTGPLAEAHCSRHPDLEFTYRCTKCQVLLCDHCVSRVRREGGIPLILCNRCSQAAVPLNPAAAEANKFLLCLRHPEAVVTHRCTNCHIALCRECVTRLRRGKGRIRFFCPVCNDPAESTTVAKQVRKPMLGKIVDSVKLPWAR